MPSRERREEEKEGDVFFYFFDDKTKKKEGEGGEREKRTRSTNCMLRIIPVLLYESKPLLLSIFHLQQKKIASTTVKM